MFSALWNVGLVAAANAAEAVASAAACLAAAAVPAERRQSFGYRSILPWPALATRGCVDEVFNSGVVSRRRRRSRDDVAEDAVEVRGKFMATRIDVDGWGEGLNIYGLFYTPFDPVMV